MSELLEVPSDGSLPRTCFGCHRRTATVGPVHYVEAPGRRVYCARCKDRRAPLPGNLGTGLTSNPVPE